jgi:hypothetical protein
MRELGRMLLEEEQLIIENNITEQVHLRIEGYICQGMVIGERYWLL